MGERRCPESIGCLDGTRLASESSQVAGDACHMATVLWIDAKFIPAALLAQRPLQRHVNPVVSFEGLGVAASVEYERWYIQQFLSLMMQIRCRGAQALRQRVCYPVPRNQAHGGGRV